MGKTIQVTGYPLIHPGIRPLENARIEYEYYFSE